jgi:glycosyltransferase involved in cell wall biosynthesis
MMAGPSDKEYKLALERENFSFHSEMRVHWPGMLTGDAKWGALAACEAFILPSHQENFGVAVVEALASAKPVLISDQVNIAPEILADGAGFVAPDTLEGTLKLLEYNLKQHENDRKIMSQRAQATFAARYDIRKNAATILRVFQQPPQAQ